MCLCSHYPETLILDIWMKRRILPHSLLTPNTSPAQTGYSHLAVLWGLEVPEAPSDLRDPQDQGALAPLWRTGKDLGVQGHPEDLWESGVPLISFTVNIWGAEIALGGESKMKSNPNGMFSGVKSLLKTQVIGSSQDIHVSAHLYYFT